VLKFPATLKHSLMENNLYLIPPAHPPRRKSPVFFLLIAVDFAAAAVFVLCISRLDREIQKGNIIERGWFRVFSIGYTIVLSIATILFLTITVSFFKAVYPAPAPFRTSFATLKSSAKATVIFNFIFSVLWCAALGVQAGELWTNIDDQADDGTIGVESAGRFWARVGITAGVMLGLLALGWSSLQGVWRNKHQRDLADELSTTTELRSGMRSRFD